MGKDTIYAKITAELKKELDIHCVMTGKKQKEVIALAIENYLKEYAK